MAILAAPLSRDAYLAGWAPERAIALGFSGYLRPDALAVIGVGERAVELFIERDLGTSAAPSRPPRHAPTPALRLATSYPGTWVSWSSRRAVRRPSPTAYAAGWPSTSCPGTIRSRAG